jgi:hypothetical protein
MILTTTENGRKIKGSIHGHKTCQIIVLVDKHARTKSNLSTIHCGQLDSVAVNSAGSSYIGGILLYCFNAFHHACKSALNKNNASPLRTDRLTEELQTTRNCPTSVSVFLFLKREKTTRIQVVFSTFSGDRFVRSAAVYALTPRLRANSSCPRRSTSAT